MAQFNDPDTAVQRSFIEGSKADTAMGFGGRGVPSGATPAQAVSNVSAQSAQLHDQAMAMIQKMFSGRQQPQQPQPTVLYNPGDETILVDGKPMGLGNLSDLDMAVKSGRATAAQQQVPGYEPRPLNTLLDYMNREGNSRGFFHTAKETGLNTMRGVGDVVAAVPRAAAALTPEGSFLNRAWNWEADQLTPSGTPDTYGHGLISRGFIAGGRALPAMGAAMGANALGPEVGLPVTGALFGAAPYEEARRTLREQGVDRDTANLGGLGVGALTLAAGTVGAKGGAALMKGTGKTIGEFVSGKPTMQAAVSAAKDPAWKMRALKDQTAHSALTSAVMAGQGGGTAAIMNAAGGEEQDVGLATRESAASGAAMALLFSPIAVRNHYKAGQMRSRAGELLVDPNAPLQRQLEGIKYLRGEIEDRMGKDAADQWQSAMEGVVDQNFTDRRKALASTDVPVDLLNTGDTPIPGPNPNAGYAEYVNAKQEEEDTRPRPVGREHPAYVDQLESEFAAAMEQQRKGMDPQREDIRQQWEGQQERQQQQLDAQQALERHWLGWERQAQEAAMQQTQDNLGVPNQPALPPPHPYAEAALNKAAEAKTLDTLFRTIKGAFATPEEAMKVAQRIHQIGKLAETDPAKAREAFDKLNTLVEGRSPGVDLDRVPALRNAMNDLAVRIQHLEHGSMEQGVRPSGFKLEPSPKGDITPTEKPATEGVQPPAPPGNTHTVSPQGVLRFVNYPRVAKEHITKVIEDVLHQANVAGIDVMPRVRKAMEGLPKSAVVSSMIKALEKVRTQALAGLRKGDNRREAIKAAFDSVFDMLRNLPRNGASIMEGDYGRQTTHKGGYEFSDGQHGLFSDSMHGPKGVPPAAAEAVAVSKAKEAPKPDATPTAPAAPPRKIGLEAVALLRELKAQGIDVHGDRVRALLDEGKTVDEIRALLGASKAAPEVAAGAPKEQIPQTKISPTVAKSDTAGGEGNTQKKAWEVARADEKGEGSHISLDEEYPKGGTLGQRLDWLEDAQRVLALGKTGGIDMSDILYTGLKKGAHEEFVRSIDVKIEELRAMENRIAERTGRIAAEAREHSDENEETVQVVNRLSRATKAEKESNEDMARLNAEAAKNRTQKNLAEERSEPRKGDLHQRAAASAWFMKTPMGKALLDGKPRDVLHAIINSEHASTAEKLLASFMLKLNILPNVELGLRSFEGARGEYDSVFDKVRFYMAGFRSVEEFNTTAARVVLHEFVHSATVERLGRAYDTYLRAHNDAEYLSDADMKYMQTSEYKAASRLIDLYGYLRTGSETGKFENLMRYYGMRDVLEFVAEGLTNRQFQQSLAQIKYDGPLGKLRSAWQAFVTGLRMVLGMPAGADTALGHLLENTAELMRERKTDGKTDTVTRTRSDWDDMRSTLQMEEMAQGHWAGREGQSRSDLRRGQANLADHIDEKYPELGDTGLAKQARKVANTLSNFGKKVFLGGAFLRDVVDAWGERLPTARTVVDVQSRRDALRLELSRPLDLLGAKGKELGRDARDKVNKVLAEFTLAEQWGYVPTWLPKSEREAITPNKGLEKTWKSLTDAQREVVDENFHQHYILRKEWVKAFLARAEDKYALGLEAAPNIIKNPEHRAAADKFISDLEKKEGFQNVVDWNGKGEKDTQTNLEKLDKDLHDRWGKLTGRQQKYVEEVLSVKRDYAAEKAAAADEIKMLNGPYTPLGREGNYFVVARSEKYLSGDDEQQRLLKTDPMHNIVEAYESFAEAKERERELRKLGIYAQGEHGVRAFEREEFIRHISENPFGAIERLIASTKHDLDVSDKVAKKIERSLMDLYIKSLADTSAKRSQLKREGIAGFNEDMLHVSVERGKATAALVASMAHGKELREAIADMRKQTLEGVDAKGNVLPGTTNDRRMLSNEIQTHIGLQTLNIRSSFDLWQNRLMRVDAIKRLLTSPAFLMQQLSEPYFMMLPVMAGEHGYDVAFAHMMEASKDAFPVVIGQKMLEPINMNRITSRVKGDVDALKELNKRGRIDLGNLSEGIFDDTGKGTVAPALARGINTILQVAAKMEGINRVTSALTAYRLSYKENIKTMGHEEAYAKAVEYADSWAWRTHGDYNATMGPRFMMQQNTPGLPVKLITQYRKFQLMQLSLFTRLLHNAFSNSGSLEKGVARRALGFLLAQHAVMTGVMGMPFYGLISTILDAVFGNKDEPFGQDEHRLREAIGNPEVASLILHGVPGWLGVPLTNRLGAGGAATLLPFGNVDLSDRVGIEHTVASAAGPVAADIIQLGDSIDLMRKGEYYKGLEQLMPSAIANSMKSYRQATEGVTNRNGDVLLRPDELTLLDKTFATLGFPTTHLQDRNMRQGILRDYQEFFKDRMDRVEHQYRKAAREGDSQTMGAMVKRWNEYNDAQRRQGLIPTPIGNMLGAPAEQSKRELRTSGGIQWTPKNAEMVSRLNQE